MEIFELYLPPVFKKSSKRAFRAPVFWSDDKLDILKMKFATTFNKDLAAELGCGWRTVIRKARELGLEKEAGFLDKKRTEIVKLIQAVRKPNPTKGMKGWQVPGGEKFQFKPGHVPASKLNPEVAKRLHASRNETIRRERIRVKIGLPPLTKLKIK
ncbi:MAG TPA: hypothetical protein VI413_00915 [Paludibacter sp.]